MKFLATFVLIGLSLSSSAFAADSATIQEIIHNVVGLQRGEGRIRYGTQIDVNIIKNDLVNASAIYDSGSISVNFFEGLLKSLTEDEVVIVVCHELGHLNGDLTLSAIGFTPASGLKNPLSVEGEADYFAGKCAVSYYMDIEGLPFEGAQEKTFFAAINAFSKLYSYSAKGQNASSRKFRGINDDYPEPDCRVLSVWNGAEGLARPKCWYNP